MAFNPATARPVNRGKFNPATARPVSQTEQVEPPAQETVSQKLADWTMAPYHEAEQAKSPSDWLGLAKTAVLEPHSAPMILEGLSNRVKGASTASLGNLLTENKIPGQDYPVARGLATGLADTALSLAPFSPSGFAGFLPMPSLLSTFGKVKSGIGKYAQKLSGKQVKPETLGGMIKEEYTGGYGKQLGELEDILGRKPEVKVPQVAEKAPEIPMEQKIQMGTELKTRRQGVLSGLKNKEEEAYKQIEGKLANSPGAIPKTVEYIKNLFGMGEGAGIANVLGETTESGIPLSTIRQQYPDYTPPINIKSIEEVNPAMPARDYGIFAKILRVGQKENITANDIKQLKTAIGQKIDWNTPRGDELNYNLIKLYRSLGEDYVDTAASAGFLKEAEAARQSSLNIYDFLDKGMIKKIGKSEFPEDIIPAMRTPSRVQQVSESLGSRDIAYVLAKHESEVKAFETGKKVSGDLMKKAKALPDVPTRKLEEVIPKADYDLHNIIQNHPSKIVDSAVRNNTPEVISAAKRNLSQDSFKFLQKGIIQKLVRENTVKSPSGVDVDIAGLGADVKKLSDSGFLDALYGAKSQEIKTLGEIAQYAGEVTEGHKFMPLPWNIRWKLMLLGNIVDMPGSTKGVLSMAEKGGGVNVDYLESLVNKPTLLSHPIQRTPGLASGLTEKRQRKK